MHLLTLLLVMLFALVIAYFCYSVYFYGGRWVANPYNPRISSQKQHVIMGTLTDRDGTVLFCHYGASLTDVPEDCAAIQSLLEEMELTPGLEPEEDELPYEELQTAVAAESRPRSRHGRERPETTDEFRPIRPVHAYPESDLEKTSMFGLFDDPYDDK